MTIRFILQLVGETYWRVADDHENAALNKFCEWNSITTTTFDGYGYLPVMYLRGTQNDLDLQKYVPITTGIYKTYVDRGGSQHDGKGNVRANAPLFIQKTRGQKMIARPYEGRFIDPRLRAPDSLPYHVAAHHSGHGSARGGRAGRR
jgi:hypothetical protein